MNYRLLGFGRFLKCPDMTTLGGLQLAPASVQSLAVVANSDGTDVTLIETWT